MMETRDLKKLKRALRQRGLRLVQERPDFVGGGGMAIVDDVSRGVVWGRAFELTLADVVDFVEKMAGSEAGSGK